MLLLPDTHRLQVNGATSPCPFQQDPMPELRHSIFLVKAVSNIGALDHRQYKSLRAVSSPKSKPNMLPILKEERTAAMTLRIYDGKGNYTLSDDRPVKAF